MLFTVALKVPSQWSVIAIDFSTVELAQEGIYLGYGPERPKHHDGRVVLGRPPVSLHHMFHQNLDVETPRGAWDIHRSQNEGLACGHD